MTTNSHDPIGLSDYQLRLPSFEGPMDVLLRLIERDQLTITDVSLMAVTDQFLSFLERLDDATPATVAEFAAIGARLVLLKSRSLLPRPAPAEENEPIGLAKQLIEYRDIQNAALQLRSWDVQAVEAFARGDGVAVPVVTTPSRLASQPASALVRALRRRLSVVPPPVHLMSSRHVVTLHEMVERILTTIDGVRIVRFSTLRLACSTRSEILTAFMAVLVLMRRRIVEADQSDVFGEITISRAQATSSRPTLPNDSVAN